MVVSWSLACVQVALLKESAKEAGKEVANGSSSHLVDLSDSGHITSEEGRKEEEEEEGRGREEGGKQVEEKVRRLESLLSKCKENIKANKAKTAALTEVKEQLAAALAAKEEELAEERRRAAELGRAVEEVRSREAGEELQMAEVKLAMHREMLGKDEVQPLVIISSILV